MAAEDAFLRADVHDHVQERLPQGVLDIPLDPELDAPGVGGEDGDGEGERPDEGHHHEVEVRDDNHHRHRQVQEEKEDARDDGGRPEVQRLVEREEALGNLIADFLRRTDKPVVIRRVLPRLDVLIPPELLVAERLRPLTEHRLERLRRRSDRIGEAGVVHARYPADGTQHQGREIAHQKEDQDGADQLPPVELLSLEEPRADTNHGDGRAGCGERGGNARDGPHLGGEDVLLDRQEEGFHRGGEGKRDEWCEHGRKEVFYRVR